MAAGLKPEQVDGDLVDDAVDAWHEMPRPLALDDQMRHILAAVLPKHADIVLRAATEDRWKGLIEKAAEQATNERLADLEKAIREQVAREIETSVCQPGEQCPDRFCPDCIRFEQAQRDAQIARGESR